jgi:membrane protease YdiL (CAAX protease family)
MLAVNAVSGAIVAALGVVTPANPVLAAITGDPLVFALYALVILAAVAPAEELLYRGAIQGGLRSAFGAGWAIVGAAGLFGLMHLGQYLVLGTPVTTAVVVSLVVIAFNGVIIGLLYERTGTLLVPIAAHGLFNVALLVIGGLGA